MKKYTKFGTENGNVFLEIVETTLLGKLFR